MEFSRQQCIIGLGSLEVYLAIKWNGMLYFIHSYASKKGHARKDGQQAWANARQILRILGLKTPAKSSLQKTAYLLDYLVQKEFLTSHYRYYRPLLPAFATFNLLNLFCH